VIGHLASCNRLVQRLWAMFVYGILLGASRLGFAGGPWWVVPIGAGLLLLENRDFNTAGDRGFSSLVFRLARNIMFVSVSFALGLAAALVFP